MTDLGTLGTYSIAKAVNNNGQIVGYSSTLSDQTHAFLYENGIMSDLGTGGSASANAYDINDDGVIVGQTWTSGIGGRAFKLENNEWTNLGTLGGNNSFAYGINNSGHIVGGAASESYSWEAFLYESGSMEAIVNTGTNSSGRVINESGQIVGEMVDGPRRPFLYENGLLKDLGSLYGYFGQAEDINNHGQIVGSFYEEEGDTSNRHAFLYDNGMWIDLGTLGGAKSVAYGINDLGQIVGYSATSSGDYHATLWRPINAVPEPTTILLLATGLVGLVGLRRKFRM